MRDFGPSRFDIFQDRLLLAIAAQAEDRLDYINPTYAARDAGLKWMVGTLREAVASLKERGLIIADFVADGTPDGEMSVAMTGKGLDELDSVEVRLSWSLPADAETATPFDEGGVPASDRVVPLNHNSEPYRDAVQAVDELTRAVCESNDLFTPDPDARELVLAELESGRRLLDAVRARVSTVMAVLGPPLRWLVEQAGSAIVKRMAETAWDSIKKLLGT